MDENCYLNDLNGYLVLFHNLQICYSTLVHLQMFRVSRPKPWDWVMLHQPPSPGCFQKNKCKPPTTSWSKFNQNTWRNIYTYIYCKFVVSRSKGRASSKGYLIQCTPLLLWGVNTKPICSNNSCCKIVIPHATSAVWLLFKHLQGRSLKNF